MNLEFSITVLGAPRSGKTSLLSSMYRQFDQVVDNSTDLEIKSTHREKALLDREVKDLQRAFNSVTQMPLNNADVVRATTVVAQQDDISHRSSHIYKSGINISLFDKRTKEEPTADIKYRFNLGEKNHKPKVQLVLRDYPGEQLAENPDEIINRVRECSVTIITIDTPLLMIDNGWSGDDDAQYGRSDTPNDITKIFAEAYGGLIDKKLVLLAPIKCEKWMDTADAARQLTDRITEKYKCLFDLLASDELQDKVAVVVTPVETLGGIMYAYMDDKTSYSPKFIKKSIAATYDPKYCDQPLRYILRFVVKRFLENPGLWFSFFGNNKPFVNAIEDFTKECLGDSFMEAHKNGFMIVQGSKLL